MPKSKYGDIVRAAYPGLRTKQIEEAAERWVKYAADALITGKWVTFQPTWKSQTAMATITEIREELQRNGQNDFEFRYLDDEGSQRGAWQIRLKMGEGE